MNEFQRWFANNGDATHRLNYNLNKDSVVFDVGGYVGDFAANIYHKYSSQVYVFEPIKEFYDITVKRFLGIDHIKVYNYGLSHQDCEQEITVDGDASSTHKQSGKTQLIQVREIGSVMEELSIDVIDLIKINIEGEEFLLLFHCLERGLTSKMDNIQVQFHNFVEDAALKRYTIRQKLEDTHNITYDYPFVWENWEKKEKE